MRILITGGAWFIGRHFAEWFVTDRHDIVVLDDFGLFYNLVLKDSTVDVRREAADKGDRTYRLVEGDVRDTDLVTS